MTPRNGALRRKARRLGRPGPWSWRSQRQRPSCMNEAPPKPLRDVVQVGGGVGRLPRALAAVRATANLCVQLCAQLLHSGIIVPEEHVLHVAAPDEILNAQDLEVAAGAMKPRHKCALRARAAARCKHLADEIVEISVPAGCGGRRDHEALHRSRGRSASIHGLHCGALRHRFVVVPAGSLRRLVLLYWRRTGGGIVVAVPTRSLRAAAYLRHGVLLRRLQLIESLCWRRSDLRPFLRCMRRGRRHVVFR
mmetsp:Transcript_21929/g.61287  ORF Transcript_21929/g.61287 Transcript_21929/m.61287 type:complete len:250 (+) Transcript_21929:51-800(+)